MSVEETLKERGSIYGDYYGGVEDRAKIMKVLMDCHEREHNMPMPAEGQGMLWDIVNKLCRLAVTPTHQDSWHDIQGYAKLAEIAVTPTHQTIEPRNAVGEGTCQ